MPSKANTLSTLIDRKLDVTRFREQHWEGTFWEYLDIVLENPAVARNAFQRVYDMILTYGSEPYTQFKQEYIRYHFFADPIDHGADAIFGLERPLMQLVDFFKSAAQGYGTEKRILLLHGPVGSQQIDHRAAAEEGPGSLLARPTPASATPTPGGCRTQRRRRRGRAVRRLPDARGAAAADPARGAAGSAGRDQRKAARGPQDPASTATSAPSAGRSTAICWTCTTATGRRRSTT